MSLPPLDPRHEGVPSYSHLALETVIQTWGISRATFYTWWSAFMQQGLDSLVYRHGGGRQPKMTPAQKQRLCAWLDAGPQAAGFESACWSTLLIQAWIRREFGVLYSRFYLGELLCNLGYSYQTARFVSAHVDEARRHAWLTQEWSQILQAAKQRQGLILFEDEASFPQWGSLSDTWAKRGQTPQIKTSGRRKGDKVFGMIEFFSGRLFYQGIEGKFNTDAYQAFLLSGLAQTTAHLFLIHEGAKYHTSKALKQFFAEHVDRITVCQLPSYSPDDNPIEYLWRKTKKLATHNQYFAQFVQVVESVENTLKQLAAQPQDVLDLFGLYTAESGLECILAA